MGYTGTTNYGFQKPAKENAFTVDDLNNALNKIDETIKNESIETVSLDTDEMLNLNLIITKHDGTQKSASTNIAKLAGVLIVQDELATATMTIIKSSNNQQFYSGPVTPQEIATGSGTFKVNIIQFGESIEKTIQVSGETILDLTEDIVIVTPKNTIISWSIDSVSIPTTNAIKVLKGITKSIILNFGTWADGSTISWTTTETFDSNISLNPTYSNPKLITSSGTFKFPKTAQYEIVLTGGGGGGGGAGAGWKYRSTSTHFQSVGSGGQGGYGGVVNAYRVNYNENDTVSVTIGSGGSLGQGGSVESVDKEGVHGQVAATSGGNGGATIFGTYRANGGNGGNGGGSGGSSTGSGGSGGPGSNNGNMSIFGSNIAHGNSTSITWLSNIGVDGTAGSRGSSTGSGGSGGNGGYGFTSNNTTKGRGGRGGNAGFVSGIGSHGGSIANGGSGARGTAGAVAIRVAV